MLLGRGLMAAPVGGAERPAAAQKTRKAAADKVADKSADKSADEAETEAEAVLLRAVERDDRFFCGAMENIPAQYYFPTDEEENWRKSAPKAAKKYHKNVLAAAALTSSKHALKRAKYAPGEHKSNEERQQDAAAEEQRLKQADASVAPVNPKTATATGLDGLKERLAVKIQALREQRKADEKTGKKRQRANANASAQPTKKPRKGGDKKAEAKGQAADKDATGEAAAPTATATEAVSAAAISYGSLLLNDEDKKKQPEKKTRNGQGLRGIKNLLKKAERNQQRMEELKKTEEGKALVQKKGWDKAIKQAAGEVVLDDPKLLRNKLKKKEKQKAKSTKEWCVCCLAAKWMGAVERHGGLTGVCAFGQETTHDAARDGEEGEAEEAADRRQARAQGRGQGRRQEGCQGAGAFARALDARCSGAEVSDEKFGCLVMVLQRAGFEGKKGEAFLNGDKKKKGKK